MKIKHVIPFLIALSCFGVVPPPPLLKFTSVTAIDTRDKVRPEAYSKTFIYTETGKVQGNQAVCLTWQAEPDARYAVEASSDLVHWTVRLQPCMDNATDLTDGTTRVFYRVRKLTAAEVTALNSRPPLIVQWSPQDITATMINNVFASNP